jgi:hypothetical protein
MLRGQHNHNHHIWSYKNGWAEYKIKGYDKSNVGTWLHDTGYHTGGVADDLEYRATRGKMRFSEGY